MKTRKKKQLKKALARIAIAVDSDGSITSTPVVETNRRVADISLAEMLDTHELGDLKTTYIFEVALEIPVASKKPRKAKASRRSVFDSSKQPKVDEPGLGVDSQ